MVKQVRFTVLGEPKGKGRPRFSTQTGRAFTPKQTVNYETLVHTEYMVQCKGFRFPDDAMLDMRILAYYSIPKSGSKKVKAQKLANVIRPTKKPDMDNVVKMVADALNQVAYKDDTQIVDCQVRKFFSEEPRIEVIIREVVPKEVKEEA
jgi:Holliday junction resolvase RusA-like endonuclease